MTIDTAKTYKATVKTDAGSFVITLDAKQAPITVNNFVFLAQKKFYNCVTFHRVIPAFMDQTGDPTGTGIGRPGLQVRRRAPGQGDARSTPSGPWPWPTRARTPTAASSSSSPGAQGESLAPDYTLVRAGDLRA